MVDMLIKASNWNHSKFPEIGRGGEAVVYKIKEDTVAKIYLPPDDPQFSACESLRKAAEERIAQMQTKLLEIPEGLPSNVVVPTGILVDDSEKVFGYTMPFVQDSKNLSEIKKGFKRTKKKTKDVLLQLHDTISSMHKKDIVIGDLNDNNILVNDKFKISLVDVDSMQFGSYICSTFIQKFTPREFLRVSKGSVNLKKKRDFLSDWYAYLVIAMRLLANTDPYGGVSKISMAQRIQKNITVFDDKNVVYPKTAVPLRSLPRPVLEVFFEAFYNKKRFVPDRSVFAKV